MQQPQRGCGPPVGVCRNPVGVEELCRFLPRVTRHSQPLYVHFPDSRGGDSLSPSSPWRRAVATPIPSGRFGNRPSPSAVGLEDPTPSGLPSDAEGVLGGPAFTGAELPKGITAGNPAGHPMDSAPPAPPRADKPSSSPATCAPSPPGSPADWPPDSGNASHTHGAAHAAPWTP